MAEDANDELEKFSLNFSRCTSRDVAPLNLRLIYGVIVFTLALFFFTDSDSSNFIFQHFKSDRSNEVKHSEEIKWNPGLDINQKTLPNQGENEILRKGEDEDDDDSKDDDNGDNDAVNDENDDDHNNKQEDENEILPKGEDEDDDNDDDDDSKDDDNGDNDAVNDENDDDHNNKQEDENEILPKGEDEDDDNDDDDDSKDDDNGDNDAVNDENDDDHNNKQEDENEILPKGEDDDNDDDSKDDDNDDNDVNDENDDDEQGDENDHGDDDEEADEQREEEEEEEQQQQQQQQVQEEKEQQQQDIENIPYDTKQTKPDGEQNLSPDLKLTNPSHSPSDQDVSLPVIKSSNNTISPEHVTRPDREHNANTHSSATDKDISNVDETVPTTTKPLTQEILNRIAEDMEVRFEVLEDIRKAVVTLRNKGITPIDGNRWSVHFCITTGMELGHLVHRSEGYALPNETSIKLTHFNGCAYKLEPTKDFKAILPGDSLRFMVHIGSTLARTDLGPRWYVAAEGLQPRVISNTAGETLDFVFLSKRKRFWDRFGYKDVTDLGKATLLVIPTPLEIMGLDESKKIQIGSEWVVFGELGLENEAMFLAGNRRFDHNFWRLSATLSVEESTIDHSFVTGRKGE